jgi:CheY-like chemotaxis protein
MREDAKTILCVDDSPASLGAWIELFDRFGYRTIATTDPQAVVPLLSCVSVHLAILDYLMPGLDGGTLAAGIRERCPLLPIVLTSNRVADVPAQVRRLVNAVLPKQDGLAALLRVVQSLLLS